MLLAKWTDFAKASVALPDGGESGRIKQAVPALIGLQGVTAALDEVDQLSAKERAAGLDMAEVLIRQYAGQINEVWRGVSLHEGVETFVTDARAALDDARRAGAGLVLVAGSLVGQHPAELVAQLLALGFAGDVFVPSPGVRFFAGCPLAFARESHGGQPPDQVCGLIEEHVTSGLESTDSRVKPRTQRVVQRGLRQVYRQFDFAKGGPVRDLVVGENELPPGQPLLVPALLGGVPQPVSLPIRGASDQDELPVVWEA